MLFGEFKLKYMSLIFLTGNQHKLREAKNILNTPIQNIDFDIEEIQGTSEEIIKHKIKLAYQKIQKPLFVEDVSLEIEAWNGFPGPYIKWLNKSVGREGVSKLMQNETNRNANVICLIGYHDGKKVHIFCGEIKGTIAKKARGENGFGFDPVFIPNGYSQTFAEMTSEEKNKISHRTLALLKFKKILIKRK